MIDVPCGTVVRNAATGEVIADLTVDDEKVLVASGGRGGRGNQHFATATRQAPRFALPPGAGEELELEMELKLMADVGLVGFPNAGKSTLISVLSAAKPKIADYPFTTLVPNLGVVRRPSGDGTVFADIPGLIEGASRGAGLGHDFLRHIERTRLLLHLVDASAENVLGDLQVVEGELLAYGHGLPERPRLVVLNKIDVLDDEQRRELALQVKAHTGVEPLLISAAASLGLDALLGRVWKALEEERSAIAAAVSALTETTPLTSKRW